MTLLVLLLRVLGLLPAPFHLLGVSMSGIDAEFHAESHGINPSKPNTQQKMKSGEKHSYWLAPTRAYIKYQ